MAPRHASDPPPSSLGFKSFIRAVLGLLAVAVFLLVLVEVFAQATYLLSGAQGRDLVELSRLPRVELPKPDQVKFHQLSEWPKDRPRQFKEAPELSDLVKAGQLPPVDRRLPEEPLVITPPEQMGPYGGEWRRFGISPRDVGLHRHRIAYEGLLRWDPLGRKILPNLAKSWEVLDGGRTFVFHLRRGVRWSDGAPFTAEDIMFWYRSCLLNKQLTPGISPDLQRGKKVVEVTKLDDYTVKFSFKEPHGLFLMLMASELGYEITQYPKHYLMKFHPDHTPEQMCTEMARARNFDFWHQLFQDKVNWANPEVPRLWAWVLKTPPPGSPIAFARNPYYWKVDPQGNQLPYIDQVHYEIFDVETINLKAINGEVGMQGRHMDIKNFQLFTTNRAHGGYRVLLWADGGTGQLVLCPNLNHKDKVKRQIFGDKRFRIALSLALNRQEINEAYYLGACRARQLAAVPGSPFHDPEYEKAFIDHNPAQANRLLDEMGLAKRDAEGFRLRPDGQTLAIQIETSDNISGAEVLQMVADYWQAVGLKATVKVMARNLYAARRGSLIHDIGVWVGAGADNPVLDPRFFFPSAGSSIQAPAFARWFTSAGKKGQKPPPEIQECMNIYPKIDRTADEAEQVKLFARINQLNRENLWVIGLVGDVPQLFIVNKRFRNVPEVAMTSWNAKTPGNTAPECYAMVGEK